MVKHRFILRSWKEAEIFAAVPTEHEVLTWRRWERPVAVANLLTAVDEQLARTAVQVADMDRIDEIANESLAKVMAQESVKMEQIHVQQEVKLRDQLRRATAAGAVEIIEKIHDVRAKLEHLRKESNDPKSDLWAKIMTNSDKRVEQIQQTFVPVKAIVERYAEQLATVRLELAASVDVAPDVFAASVRRIREISIVALRDAMAAYGEERDFHRSTTALLTPDRWKGFSVPVGPDPSDVLTCPEGVPFPYYTIEIPFPSGTTRFGSAKTDDVERVVVEVVEGAAWFEAGAVAIKGGGDLREIIAWQTDTVRMASELVTQMLTERQRNPRAETRVLVDEVNSAKAQEVRREEARSGAEPRVRSIKFDVAPPRYLRAAAERIIASKVRAHWVMGHWRNQPYGEGRRLHRQTWIAPHVRGLGEAGATMSKVAAPKAG